MKIEKPDSGTSKYYSKHLIVLSMLLMAFLGFLPHYAVSQSKVFEVFGAQANENLGVSAVCTSPGIFIGVPGAPGLGAEPGVGQVRLYNPINESLNSTIHPPQTLGGAESFGWGLLPIPDSNDNKTPELVIASPAIGSPDIVPRVFVYDQTDFQTPIRTLFGIIESEFGSSLAFLNYPNISLPDLIPDLAIGAPKHCNGSISFCSSFGLVSFFDIQSGGIYSTITPPTGYADFGASLSRIEDLTNNGTEDLVVGSPGAANGDGSALFYDLVAANSPIPFREIKGTNLEAFGSKVLSVGDLNNDTLSDVLISAPKANSNKGAVRLYSGADLANNLISAPTPLCEIFGVASGDLFGSALSLLGDSKENNLKQFAIGAPGASGQIGTVGIFEYSPSTGCQLKRSLTGTSVGDDFGKYLNAEPCQPTTDGLLDLIVGSASDKNGTDSGSAAIYSVLPTPTPTATPTATATPIEPTSSRLTFRISEDGEFKIHTSYDQEPGDSCSHILYGRITVGAKKLPLIKLRSGITHDGIINEDNKIIKILNFPTAEKIDGVVPVIHMLLRTTCGERTFDSNVFARFMNCGTPNRTVSLEEWARILIKALDDVEKQTSIRSDRILKIIRLRKFRQRLKIQ